MSHDVESTTPDSSLTNWRPPPPNWRRHPLQPVFPNDFVNETLASVVLRGGHVAGRDGPRAGSTRPSPMHNPFDQLAKKVGKEALGPSGRTVVQYEISRGAQHADLLHDPDPARHAERARLGLLGRLASVLCLIEVYAHAPSGEELRACLIKHFTYWQGRLHEARAVNKKRKEKDPRLPPEPLVEPFLWIIAATVSAPVLKKLKVEPEPSHPAGVYVFGDDLFRAGLVVASELPRERSTLLVRIMAAGPGLPQAIAELAALPPDAHERTVAEDILVHLRHALGDKPSRTPEEEDFVVIVNSNWRQARELGRDEARASDVLTVLRVRGIAVPDAVRERILAERDSARLERWLERAVLAASVTEVLDEPS
ncbi:MAG: hypothetical protein QM820_58565 [Minicystis sp.]